MRINKLVITNFGIYYGKNEFVFNSNNENTNIILIGGKNGTGKTTFLSAIKLALYGPLFLGYKNANAKYLDFIRDKINIYSVNEGNNSSSVELYFDIINNGEVENYYIIRTWKLSNYTVKEYVQIFRNDNLLPPSKSEEFINFLRRSFPPSLFDFLFFDGEKVQQYFLDPQFEKNIKDAFMIFFNLDLFDILKEDLIKYLKQDNIFSMLTDEQREYTQIEIEIKSNESDIRILEENIFQLKEKIRDLKIKINELEKEFSLKGGIIAQEREKLQEKIILLEQERKQNNEKIKDFAAELLPFIIVKNLLQQTSLQINTEEQIEKYQVLKQELGNETLPFVLNILINQFQILDKEGNNASSLFMDSFIKKLFEHMKPVNMNDAKLIHQMNKEQKRTLFNLDYTVQNFDNKFVDQLFSNNHILTQQIHELKKKLEFNQVNESLNEISKAILEHNRLLLKTQEDLETKIAKLSDAQKYQSELISRREKIQKRIQKAKKDENIFELCQKINRVLARYQETQIINYIENIEKYFLQIFNDLSHKGKFLTSFKINPITFEFEMYNNMCEPVTKYSLSAGEIQLFFLSLLFALIKASNKDIPLVLDTFFARLDNTHKLNLIQKFLPIAAKQIFILTTNSEIDNFYYEKIKPYIKQEFTLQYDNKLNRVKILNYYILNE